MRKILCSAVVLFLISACEQAPDQRTCTETNDNIATVINTNKDNAGIENKDPETQAEPPVEPPSFDDILAILNETEQILCAGDCGEVLPQSPADAETSEHKNEDLSSEVSAGLWHEVL